MGISPSRSKDQYSVPSPQDMGYPKRKDPLKFPGGETEALRRLKSRVMDRADWVAAFEKPNTAPNSIEPSTTVLSPYLSHGSLSAALMFNELSAAIKNKKASQPPVSLHGQLLWREFFYLQGATTPNFDRMVGNPKCRQIPWDNNEEYMRAWKEGRTGYPFIDAIMRQLKQEGWIHHLARHAVACFLTRGDLYQSWEVGAKIFEEELLDFDWSLNAANWQWLSCSNFFYQYFRCYSPIAFGKKTDAEGAYIRKYVPELREMSSLYIYDPSKAPKSAQVSAGCVIGKDYPLPIVEHSSISKINMGRMKEAYDSQPGAAAESPGESEEDDEEATKKKKRKTKK